MISVEDAKRRKRQSIAAARGKDSPVVFGLLLLTGMVISGMVQRATYTWHFSRDPDHFSSAPNNESTVRRYCHPPNVTILTLYEIYYNSEENSSEKEYDFAEMEEMDFQMELSSSQEAALWRWQVFQWGWLLAPIPAARLAACMGSSRVFGFCLFSSATIGLLGSSIGLTAQSISVFLQGLFTGSLQPCALLLIHSTTTQEKWVTFLALLSGEKLGFGLTEFLPTHLRAFITCIVGAMWLAPWVLMLNTPRLIDKKRIVPWRKVLTSRVVWMSAVAVFGAELLHATTSYTLRLYIDVVYYLTNANIFTLTTSYGLTFLFALFCAKMSCTVETMDLLSRTTARRVFVYISHFIPSGLLFVSCFVGCAKTAPLSLFALSTTIGGATYTGAFASTLDVASNYAGVVVALVCTSGAVARLLPVLQTSLIFDGLMPGSWRLVLSVNALVGLLTAMFFMLRGSSRPPTHNYPDVPVTSSSKTVPRLTIEGCLLKVLTVQETERFTRARACSTSVTRTECKHLSHHLKRASIS